MKKIYLLALCMTLSGISTYAAPDEIDDLRQEIEAIKAEKAKSDKELKQLKKDNSIWGRNRSFSIGYINATLNQSSVGLPDRDARYGVLINNNKIFYLHNKAIANILKFGIDLGIDINYINYDKGHNFKQFDFDTSWRPGSDASLIDYTQSYLGTHQLDFGINVGPSLTVAPFAFSSAGINSLKATVYYHLTPSLSTIFFSQNDELKSSWAFNLYQSLGLKLSYKAIGIGIEQRFGQGKYKALPIAYYEYEESMGSQSYSEEGYWYGTAKEGDIVKYKISELRLFLSINF